MKLKYTSGALVLNTEISFDEIKNAVRFAPETLTVRDEKDNMVYQLSATAGEGSINSFSLECNTLDDNVLTLVIPAPVEGEETVKEVMSIQYGSALAAAAKYLPIIKGQIAEAVAPINNIMSAFDEEEPEA